MSEGKVWYQPRCIYCDREHYVMNVPDLSHGRNGCHNCGKIPPVFTTREDYQAALAEGRRQLQEKEGKS